MAEEYFEPDDREQIFEDGNKDTNKEKKEKSSFFWEFLKVLIVSIVIVVPIRIFIVQPFIVDGASMDSNFHDKDYLIVNEVGYYFSEPERGDVIVFKYNGRLGDYFIKRIVGLPGETVEIKDNKIYITDTNNKRFILDETSYLSPDEKTSGTMKVELSDEEYFVLGDNRDQSSDSRTWGALTRSEIVGRAWLRLLPFGGVGFIDRGQSSL